MIPEIRTLGEITLIGHGANFISILSPDADNAVIPRLWDRLFKRIEEIPERRNAAVAYGLCSMIDNEQERRHPAELFYLAGVEVAPDAEVPEEMLRRVVPPATYAVFTHVGRIDALGATMHSIYNTWLPESGLTLAMGPDLELYDKRFDHASESSEMDIYIPVEPAEE